jgi:hypothetical protein
VSISKITADRYLNAVIPLTADRCLMPVNPPFYYDNLPFLITTNHKHGVSIYTHAISKENIKQTKFSPNM